MDDFDAWWYLWLSQRQRANKPAAIDAARAGWSAAIRTLNNAGGQDSAGVRHELAVGEPVSPAPDAAPQEPTQHTAIPASDSPTPAEAALLADKIIAGYKEHYSFPWQGESHMHDCMAATLLNRVYKLCEFLDAPRKKIALFDRGAVRERIGDLRPKNFPVFFCH